MAGISLTEEQIRQTGEVFTRESARLREQEGIVANRQVDPTTMGQVLFGEAEAHQRDTENDTRLIGNGKQVLGQAANTAATSDELLNAARPALVFFERFMPLYNKWTFSSLTMESAVYARFDRLRGINSAAFRADGASLKSVEKMLSDSERTMHGAMSSLAAHWHGKAADTAADHVTKYLSAAQEVNRRFGTVSAHTVNLANGMATSVQQVLKLYDDSWEESPVPRPTVRPRPRPAPEEEDEDFSQREWTS